jgi:hypothetical protein
MKIPSLLAATASHSALAWCLGPPINSLILLTPLVTPNTSHYMMRHTKSSFSGNYSMVFTCRLLNPLPYTATMMQPDNSQRISDGTRKSDISASNITLPATLSNLMSSKSYASAPLITQPTPSLNPSVALISSAFKIISVSVPHVCHEEEYPSAARQTSTRQTHRVERV